MYDMHQFSPLPVLSFFSSLFTHPAISWRVPPDEPGPSQGFFLLKANVSLPLLLTGGQAPGFCEALRHTFI